MTNRIRAIIFWSFLVLFLVAAPTVLLYTSGYRYSFKKGRVEQVGGLVLKTQPRDAAVILNGRTIPERAPINLKLIPDEYHIEVTKEGYQPWVKTLPVKSRETTFIEDVVLWKESSPVTLRALDSNESYRILLTPDLARAVLFAGKELSVFDFLRGTEAQRATIDQYPDVITTSLSPTGSSILISERTADLPRRIIIRLETGERIDLASITSRRLEEVMWGETDGTLYATTIKQDFLAINLFTGRTDVIGRAGTNALLRGTDIWSIIERDGQTILAKSRAGDPATPPEAVSELPAAGYEFLPVDTPYLLLHEYGRDRILLIDTRRPTELIADLPGMQARTRRNRDGDLELLAWNAFELWRANAQTTATELLRRQSDHLIDALWSPRGEYIIFNSFDSSVSRIEALELDNRDERNLTRLAEIRDNFIETIATDSRGAKLYFAITDGAAPGLYSLELQ